MHDDTNGSNGSNGDESQKQRSGKVREPTKRFRARGRTKQECTRVQYWHNFFTRFVS